MKQIFATAFAWSAIAGAVAFAAAASAGPQSPAAPVFTAEQAAAGKAIFVKACASCHLADLTGNDDAPALAGKAFQDLWKRRTLKELLDYMSGAMPPGGSTLSAEDYRSIAAYILERNGATAGPERLTATSVVEIGRVIK
jgi:mono/diheme cytochrome c family protein